MDTGYAGSVIQKAVLIALSDPEMSNDRMLAQEAITNVLLERNPDWPFSHFHLELTVHATWEECEAQTRARCGLPALPPYPLPGLRASRRR